MKYLELDVLNPINYFLAHVDTNDRSRIYGRVEAYSCSDILLSIGKSAGQDKKLYKKMKLKDGAMTLKRKASSTRYSSARVLYYLIACMNQIFSDYDFRLPATFLFNSDLTLDNFVEEKGGMYPIIEAVDTTLFNAGLFSNVFKMKDFSQQFWGCLDQAINFKDCQIFSYLPDVDSNPFIDEYRQCM